MTKTQYGSYRDAFKAHFKLKDGTTYSEIEMTKKVISYNDLMALTKNIKDPADPLSMRLTYGLDTSNHFVLLLELMEETATGIVPVPGSLVRCTDFSSRGTPVPTSPAQQKTYSDAYINTVWYVDGANDRHLTNGGNTPDPTSIWFDWETEVMRELEANAPVEGSWLVLDCMSAQYDLSGFGYPDAYRHGMGLNIAKVEGGVLTDHLDDIDHSLPPADKDPANYKAMDLGNLHPPRWP